MDYDNDIEITFERITKKRARQEDDNGDFEIVYDRTKKKLKIVFDSGECPVCYSDPQVNAACPPCGHVCCLQCLVEWSKRSSTCPVCVTKFTYPDTIESVL